MDNKLAAEGGIRTTEEPGGAEAGAAVIAVDAARAGVGGKGKGEGGGVMVG